MVVFRRCVWAVACAYLVLATGRTVAGTDDDFGLFADRVVSWIASYRGTSYKSGDSGTLAWSEAYVLRVLLEAYRITGEREYLRKLAARADTMFATAYDVPGAGSCDPAYADGYLGWGTRTYSDQYDEYLVHDGHVCTPIAEFIATVYRDSSLWDEFGAKAQAHLAFIQDHIVEKWFSVWNGKPATARFHLTKRDWAGLAYAPYNQYAAFGSMLLFLYDVARTPRWAEEHPGESLESHRVVATGMAYHFDTALRINGAGAYTWQYHSTCGPEDISHANLELEFVRYCWERGIVFDDGDVERFARTITTLLWNGDLERPLFADAVDGTGNTDLSFHLWGWSLISEVDPLAWHLCATYYHENETVSAPLALAAMARLQRLRARPLSRGVIVSRRVSVLDDGDQVIGPGETVAIAVEVQNVGRARDSTWVKAGYIGRLIRVSAPDSVLVRVDPGGSAQATFAVRAPADVETATLDLVLFVGYLRTTRTVMLGSPSLLFVEGAAPADGREHNLFYPYLSLPINPHRLLRTDDDTLTTATLSRFEAVIWRGAWAMPSPQQRDTLAAFLDAGGKLLFTGGGMLAPFMHRSPDDSLFLARYLKITHAVDAHDSLAGKELAIEPKCPEEFPGGGASRRYLRASDDLAGAIHADVFATSAPETRQVSFSATDRITQERTSLPYDVIGVGVDSTYTAIFLGFDLDDVSSYFSVRGIVRDALAWLADPTSVSDADEEQSLRPSALRVAARPNPFNSAMEVHVKGLATRQTAVVTISNVLGQLVFRRTIAPPASEVRMLWDGTDDAGRSLASGTYVVTVRQAERRTAIRVQMVR